MFSADDNWPPRALFWRTWFETERFLGTLPMLILMPGVGAIIGTALAVSNPSLVTRHGVVVLVGGSFWEALGLALAGAVGGVLVIGGVVFWGVWVWYRLLGGDRVWDAGHAEIATPTSIKSLLFFELRCKGPLPIQPETLGALGCTIKTPSGLWLDRGAGRTRRHDPEGIVVRTDLEPEPGRYEVRWYAEEGRGRLHEIARAGFVVAEDGGKITRLPEGVARLRAALRVWRGS